VFKHYDCFTVGETVFVNPKKARDLIHPERRELTMLFQFDHMAADNYFVKWFMRKFKPFRLKKALSKWQNELDGWNTLYLENHDQSRSVSRFGNEEYHYESATLLATILYFQQGTPFIYQGQEIGMLNASFPNLEDYQDIETHNIYKFGRKIGLSHRRMMNKIKKMSRDNARTPMQWNDNKYAGFSDSEPWLKVNPNYKRINVEKDITSKNSIFNYYRKIVELRKKNPVIIYGDYRDIDYKNRHLYIYERKLDETSLYVIANYSDKPKAIKEYDFLKYELILSNYDENSLDHLKPYEARVYIKK
jgi:oligo-1,6-glucosidase